MVPYLLWVKSRILGTQGNFLNCWGWLYKMRSKTFAFLIREIIVGWNSRSNCNSTLVFTAYCLWRHWTSERRWWGSVLWCWYVTQNFHSSHTSPFHVPILWTHQRYNSRSVGPIVSMLSTRYLSAAFVVTYNLTTLFFKNKTTDYTTCYWKALFMGNFSKIIKFSLPVDVPHVFISTNLLLIFLLPSSSVHTLQQGHSYIIKGLA